ncbi:MAG: ABC transporter substrate-binding protein, partial [Chloroflexi bacterium]|nr:ABC transporter substrate-binding protein [Chloroflexota bacterium]
LLLAACATPTVSPTPTTPTGTATPAPKASPTPTPTPISKLTPQYGGTLRIIRTRVGSFGYPLTETAGDRQVAMPAQERVLEEQSDGSPRASLAMAWKIAPDLKSLTLTLRKGVKFHDGTALNATSAKWNFDKVMVGKKEGTESWTSIDVIDDYTVRINLSGFQNIVTNYLASAAGTMVSPTAVEKNGADWARLNPVGTGPFKFVSYTQDVNLKYESFDGYWGGKPYLDGVEYVFIQDAQTRLMSFLKGDGEVLLAPEPKDMAELKAKGYQVIAGESSLDSLSNFFPDSVNPDSPFKDKRVRQAVEYAIDKEAIVKALGYGYWRAAYQFIPADHPSGYNSDIQGRRYNPSKAKELLAAAGYPKGFKTTLTVAESSEAWSAIATNLKEVGIEALIEVGSRARRSEMDQKGWKNGLIEGPLGGVTNWNFHLVKMLSPDSPRWVSTLRPPGWREALNAALASPDPSTAKKATQNAVKFLYEEAVSLPLWSTAQIRALKPNVHDTGLLTSGHTFTWTPEKAWLSK